jgi:hypothetical protein
MLVGEPGAIAVGDRVVVPWLPDWDGWSISEVTADYYFEPLISPKDFGHVVPVELRQANVNPQHHLVTGGLRASMRCRLRMWNLDSFAADIEALLYTEGPSEVPAEVDRLDAVMNAMTNAAVHELLSRYQGAEFERPVQRLMEALFGGQVEHTGGRSERGADLICRYQDALGTDHAAAVQIKMWTGQPSDHLTRAVEQVRQAYGSYEGITSGVIVTLLNELTEAAEEKVAAVANDLHIPVRVLLKDDVARLFMQHLPTLLSDADADQ